MTYGGGDGDTAAAVDTAVAATTVDAATAGAVATTGAAAAAAAAATTASLSPHYLCLCFYCSHTVNPNPNP